jgi:hypothetical protein
MRENETFSRGHGGKKPNKLHLFITALLSNDSVESASKAAGIAASTGWRWMKDPAVVTALREARQNAVERAMARLQQAMSGAVDCLCQVQSEGESESARVSAARTVLEQALRSVELQDIQQRIDKLEAIVKSRKGAGNDNQPNHAASGNSRGVNGRA